LNQRALSVGTANAIELRRMSRQPAAPAPANQAPAAPAPAPVQPPAPQQTPQGQQPGTPQAQGGPASFSFDPPTVTQPVGSSIAVNVLLSGSQNVYSVPLQVSYDPKVLQVVNVSNGGFLSQDGQAVALVHRDDGNGTLQITATRPPGAGGVSGQGAVVTLTFQAKSAGQSTLTISKGGARDPGMQPLPVAGAVANVVIQ
jgi:general secretion pathway protein D